MQPLLQLLVISSCLLAVIALVQLAASRTQIPETCLLAVVGIGFGAGYLNLKSVAPEFADFLLGPLLYSWGAADAYLWLFLPPLLFQLAIKADVRSLLADAAPILVLAIVAVLVATATIGLSLSIFSSQSLATCLLLGAIVATTDPSAVVGIFHDVGAPRRLTNLLEGESLLNDAAAIALVGALTATAAGTAENVDWLQALLSLGYSFGGGLLIGAIAGRLLSFSLSLMGGVVAAETALTLALPYPLYLFCTEVADVSGVVAVVCAGLVVKALAGTRLSARSFDHIQIVWQQIAMLAGALVFLLAAVRVPELLSNTTWGDIQNVGVVIVSALGARFAILFAVLPALTRLKLSAPISTAYKLVATWGGLRGAVTLVLAMGISQSPLFPTHVQHFISATATGFVLFSLLVNGGSLPWLIRTLGLNRPSDHEMAQQQQAVTLAIQDVQLAVFRMADQLHIRETIAADVNRSYETASAAAFARPTNRALNDHERLELGLIILATKERDLIPDYGEGVISISNLDAMTRNAGDMIDAARLQGRDGYYLAARRILEPSLKYRAASALYRTFRIRRPLESALADRFELLLCRCAVLERLLHYNRVSVAPLLGSAITLHLEGALLDRIRFSAEALQSLREQNSAFTDKLEQRLLTLFALKQGRAKIDTMAAERVISGDIHNSVTRRLDRAWKKTLRRPTNLAP